MNMRVSLLFFFFLAPVFLTAQKKFAEKVVSDLCSPEFHGRGYVNEGHRKAAEYIATKFGKWGIRSFGDTYFQEFPVNVNTFPSNMEVVLDGDTLDPGHDFIVNPRSQGVKGDYELFTLNKDNFAEKLQSAYATQNFFEGKAAVFDPYGFTSKDTLKEFLKLRYLVAKRCPVVVLEYEDLNWGGATDTLPNPIVKVLVDSGHGSFENLHLNVENVFKEDLWTQNVMGYVEGTENPDSFLAVSAHYDHLGRMGKDTYIPGANDNASGTAMMLFLARHYAKNPPPFSVAFLGFGAEEIGILGSRYFVKDPPVPLQKIGFLLNLDILGTGGEGITVVNGKFHSALCDRLDSINKEKGYLKKIKRRGKAKISDHHWFTEEGVPAFFIYTLGGIDAYHDVHDKAETLPLTEFNDLAVLFREFLSTFWE